LLGSFSPTIAGSGEPRINCLEMLNGEPRLFTVPGCDFLDDVYRLSVSAPAQKVLWCFVYSEEEPKSV
jgi:hypothetical protein